VLKAWASLSPRLRFGKYLRTKD